MNNRKHNITAIAIAQAPKRREILFRGKRLSDGEWITGYYVGPCSVLNTTDIVPLETGSSVEVDPDTVGQYTGQTDKYGARIYEGDIVEINSARGVFMFGAVSYNEVVSSYEIKNRERESEMTFFPSELHVVGNIYDNPGLMGKGGKI